MTGNGDYATKTDLKELRTELKGDMAVLRDELKGDMASLRDELVEAIHDSETKLLKAFYDYAETNRVRMAAIETERISLAQRLAIVEDKILRIEKKLDLPNGYPTEKKFYDVPGSQFTIQGMP